MRQYHPLEECAKELAQRAMHVVKEGKRSLRREPSDVNQLWFEVVHCLVRAVECRDDTTGRHILRVGKYTRLICHRLGMSQEDQDVLEAAAQLHDVGKIGVPDAILLKPGRLTTREYEEMKRHCVIGEWIVGHAGENRGQRQEGEADVRSFCAIAGSVALSHHERWDGCGYPCGLIGEGIPLEARITAVADTFDALSSIRPYRAAKPLNECFEVIKRERGSHFDPAIADVFLSMRSAVEQVHNTCWGSAESLE